VLSEAFEVDPEPPFKRSSHSYPDSRANGSTKSQQFVDLFSKLIRMGKENNTLTGALSRQDRPVEGHPASPVALAPPSTGDGDDEDSSHALKMIDEVMGSLSTKSNRRTFSDAMVDLEYPLGALSAGASRVSREVLPFPCRQTLFSHVAPEKRKIQVALSCGAEMTPLIEYLREDRGREGSLTAWISCILAFEAAAVTATVKVASCSLVVSEMVRSLENLTLEKIRL
jgi:hypothetical protein